FRTLDMGQRFRIAGETAAHRFEDAFAPFGPLEAFGQRAQRGEALSGGRRLHGDVADGVVLEHAGARHVTGLRLTLAPGCDLDQNAQLLWLADAGLSRIQARSGSAR